MTHVFLETNWVINAFAPPFTRLPAARALLTRAERGDIQIHIPGISLAEGVRKIPTLHKPRAYAGMEYIRHAVREGDMTDARANEAREAHQLYRTSTNNYLRNVAAEVATLRTATGVTVFNLDDEMLEYCFTLRDRGIHDLKPFDEAILSAVLCRAAALSSRVEFRTIDGDFSPDRSDPKSIAIKAEYEAAGVDFFPDFG